MSFALILSLINVVIFLLLVAKLLANDGTFHVEDIDEERTTYYLDLNVPPEELRKKRRIVFRLEHHI